MLVVDNEEPNLKNTEQPPEVDPPSIHPQFFALSTTALYGLSSLQALRITAYIHHQPVTILIDCGSTHNIIQPSIVSLFGLPTTTIREIPVMVDNGDHIK